MSNHGVYVGQRLFSRNRGGVCRASAGARWEWQSESESESLVGASVVHALDLSRNWTDVVGMGRAAR